MAFHFPLMPRLFLSLAQEDPSPIVSTVTRSQDVPASCQWALFLRNHDELTLSAVPDPERRVLLEAYAPEPRMRLNHGIRRRLAPLLNNNQALLELAHALLLSLPGSPVLYYGDEIGMGDNVVLSDRDGLRTPMQWSDDIHGGFARTSVAHLIVPAIDDYVYGYRAVNVAAQLGNAGSLLAAVKRLIGIRGHHKAFGRGSIEFLDCGNPHVIAFTRQYGEDTIMVVANLSTSPQEAAVTRSAVSQPGGAALTTLVDLIDGTHGSIVGAGPVQLLLEAHACRWFQLVPAAAGTEVGPSVVVS
jgi:maltose alpha-D-glucosyltransferase/alpha-amylase